VGGIKTVKSDQLGCPLTYIFTLLIINIDKIKIIIVRSNKIIISPISYNDNIFCPQGVGQSMMEYVVKALMEYVIKALCDVKSPVRKLRGQKIQPC